MVSYCRPWASEQFELIRAEDTRLTMPHQATSDYKLALIERGSRAFYYRRAISTATSGSLVVIHPGEVNGSWAVEGGATVRILSVSPALLLEATGQEREGESLPFFSSSLISDPELTGGLIRLLTALDGPTSALEQQTRLFDFLTLLLQGRVAAPPGDPPGGERGPVERARAFLDENYAQDVSLKHLGQIAGLSPCYLCRAFRRWFGVPPHAYQTGVRIARARTLLAAGQPAGQVASLTGFFDQAHFTHLFTRYVKTTPGAYAKAVRSTSYKTAGVCSV